MLSWICSVSSALESGPKAPQIVWALGFPPLLQDWGRSPVWPSAATVWGSARCPPNPWGQGLRGRDRLAAWPLPVPH